MSNQYNDDGWDGELLSTGKGYKIRERKRFAESSLNLGKKNDDTKKNEEPTPKVARVSLLD